MEDMQAVGHDLLSAAERRINAVPALKEHEDVLLWDAYDGRGHYTWILTAEVDEIVGWCDRVERDTRRTGR